MCINILRYILFPVSLVFQLIIFCRDFLYKNSILKSSSLSLPTISVGNIVVGGTGKSPFVKYLAKQYDKDGSKVIILTRGYKSSLSKNEFSILSSGQVVYSNAKYNDFNLGADEALMQSSSLENHFVVVGADRYRSFNSFIQKYKSNMFKACILDDGFQHLRIKRDLDIVMLDYNTPFGNNLYLPSGDLRVRKKRLLEADVVVFSRAPSLSAGIPSICRDYLKGKKVFNAVFKTTLSLSKGEIAANEYVVVANIANSQRLLNELKLIGVKVKKFISKGDHCKLAKADFDMIDKINLSVITTLKDYYRQKNDFDLIKNNIYKVELEINCNLNIRKLLPN